MSSSSAHRLWSGPDHRGGFLLGLVAKRTYRWAGGHLSLTTPEPLFEHAEQRMDERTAHPFTTHDGDLSCFWRQKTDVVVNGSVHAPSGGTVTTLDAGIAVGSARAMVRVTGDRRLQVRRDGRLSASTPEPFAEMPLCWTRAYGGRDRAVEAPRECSLDGAVRKSDVLSHATFSYPRNPVGRGFFLDRDRERLDGELLPNLSDPADPVSLQRLLVPDFEAWERAPRAASLGPVDPRSFPRSFFFGLGPGEVGEVVERSSGELGASDSKPPSFYEPDPRAFQVAPHRLQAELHGGEPMAMWRLCRDAERLELTLPSDRPRMLVEPPGTRVFELEPRLRALRINPDEGRLTMTWCAAIPVAAPYDFEDGKEIPHAVVFPS
ncbi:MAG: DUF2169 domain-containing protein [Myxococcales bacterium]|nr:DUF2169 domain-containing protein [Myxococcales bacterium]